ncbi:MAG: DUF167 domain-containing protein [Syntrophales bacterium]|nr:DUF167 domain-containing protein [Syntrophales bacterium]
MADLLQITETEKGVIFSIRVIPRSSRAGIAGIHGGSLKIRITAPPLEGRANEACISFLADLFRVPKGSVEILGGSKTKNKRVFVAGITKGIVESLISEI